VLVLRVLANQNRSHAEKCLLEADDRTWKVLTLGNLAPGADADRKEVQAETELQEQALDQIGAALGDMHRLTQARGPPAAVERLRSLAS
jgi:hypothetical protein